jgi:hypothetical protein
MATFATTFPKKPFVQFAHDIFCHHGANIFQKKKHCMYFTSTHLVKECNSWFGTSIKEFDVQHLQLLQPTVTDIHKKYQTLGSLEIRIKHSGPCGS